MSNISQKVNKSRYSLKDILSNEWDTSSIKDYSEHEIDKLYSIPSANLSYFPGVAGVCNFSVDHKKIPSHKLHIIYYNFPENGKKSSKVTKSACDKLYEYYNTDEIDTNDSLFVIINEPISESLEKSCNSLNIRLQSELLSNGLSETIQGEMDKNNVNLETKHFRNVHIFNINNFTNNILKHRLVPEHKAIREMKSIEEILKKCNTNIDHLPIILKSDIMSKMLRLASGDICEITRSSDKCGSYPFYRVCK
jgi:DNA-directed RNA polymerase subunit H (RpoH/RPB5)